MPYSARISSSGAARAAPYEKGTETRADRRHVCVQPAAPRARPPMRRGLKRRVTHLLHHRAYWPRARPPMRRGLKRVRRATRAVVAPGPRARPPMRRGLKLKFDLWDDDSSMAARAAPYEKGTETFARHGARLEKQPAARAAPYEKGTETRSTRAPCSRWSRAARAAPYEKGTETCNQV